MVSGVWGYRGYATWNAEMELYQNRTCTSLDLRFKIQEESAIEGWILKAECNNNLVEHCIYAYTRMRWYWMLAPRI